MAPTAGVTLGLGLIASGICLIDYFVRRSRGAHGV